MTGRNPLRAVTEGEKPAPRKGVKAAADTGTRRELLEALRSRIAASVEDPKTPPRDLAALSRRLLEIAKEIEAMDAEAADDDISAAAATPDEKWAAT